MNHISLTVYGVVGHLPSMQFLMQKFSPYSQNLLFIIKLLVFILKIKLLKNRKGGNVGIKKFKMSFYTEKRQR